MFRDVTLGQYYPTESFVHKLDPRVKIILNILYLVGIFFVKSFFGYAIILAFLLLAIFASRVPISSVLKSIKGILILVFITALLNVFFYVGTNVIFQWWIITIYSESLIFAGQMVLRLMFLVTGASLLTLTTTPVDLTHAIESLLKPLNWIKFPVHELALIMSLALSFIPSLIDETDRIIRAQKARGADFDTGGLLKRAKAFIPILIPLLVSSFRRADELALAMNSRCYEGSTKRTKMHKLKFTFRDLTAILITTMFFTAVFILYSWCTGVNVVVPKLNWDFLYFGLY